MWPFEKEICTFFDNEGIDYQFDDQEGLLRSNKVIINFIADLSENEFTASLQNEHYTINLWEDIYFNRKPQVISRLRSILGLNKRLHGRQTTIKPLEKQAYADFLEQHHLMGATPAKFRLGLYHDRELVSVAGFGRECPIDWQAQTYRSHELIRFCNRSGITVVGGLSKLINSFVTEKDVEHLMTYVDREWSAGAIYKKLGFDLIETTAPQEFLLSPQDNKRYRASELRSVGVDYSKWQKLSNLGNYKFIKIYP